MAQGANDFLDKHRKWGDLIDEHAGTNIGSQMGQAKGHLNNVDRAGRDIGRAADSISNKLDNEDYYGAVKEGIGSAKKIYDNHHQNIHKAIDWGKGVAKKIGAWGQDACNWIKGKSKDAHEATTHMIHQRAAQDQGQPSVADVKERIGTALATHPHTGRILSRVGHVLTPMTRQEAAHGFSKLPDHHQRALLKEKGYVPALSGWGSFPKRR